MKTILTLVSCLALTGLVFAQDGNDQNPKKKNNKGGATNAAAVNQGGKGQNKGGGGGGKGQARNFQKANGGNNVNNATKLNTTNNVGKNHRKLDKVTTANGTGVNNSANVNNTNKIGGGKGGKKNKAINAATTANTGATGNTGVVKANKNKTFNASNTGNNAAKLNGANSQFVKGKNGTTHAKFALKKLQVVAAPKANIASVQFQQGYHIANAQNWGPKYVVFQNYSPVWHDHGWWQSNYGPTIILVGGGYYYQNAGYWYPAWGYDNSVAYYPYDGPIYAPHNLPPDQVIANVQTALQQLGYYQNGAVDGLLGPMTRAAIAQYQNDNGLAPTETVDEPTLASLGMS